MKKKRMNISMKEMYYVDCNKYRKIVNSNISNIFDKILVFFNTWSKCDNDNNSIFKEESVEILKFAGFIDKLNWVLIILNAKSFQIIILK